MVLYWTMLWNSCENYKMFDPTFDPHVITVKADYLWTLCLSFEYLRLITVESSFIFT